MDESGSALDGLLHALAQAVLAMLTALLMLALAALTLLARALQALFVLARPALYIGSAAAAGAASLVLFPTVLARYGDDLPAALLALVLVTSIPASLLVLAQAKAGLWPTLWASAALEMLAHWAIERAPPVVLALVPCVALTACILWAAFKSESKPEEEKQEEGDQPMEGKQSGSGVLLWLITGALLIFTAFRSVHLVQSTMPPDAQILAYAALAGLDFGVLAWLFWTTRSARGGTQRTIGTLMIIVDLTGIAAAVLGDTMLVADAGNQELVSTVAVWIVPIIIWANIAACVVAHIADPAQALRDARRSVADEIERQTAEIMTQNASTTAEEIARQRAEHLSSQTVAGYRPGLDVNRDGQVNLDDLKAALAQLVGGNGKGKGKTMEADGAPPKSKKGQGQSQS